MKKMANIEKLVNFLDRGFSEDGGIYTMEYKNSLFEYDLLEEKLTIIDDEQIGNITTVYTNVDTLEKLILRLNHVSLLKYGDYIVDTSSL